MCIVHLQVENKIRNSFYNNFQKSRDSSCVLIFPISAWPFIGIFSLINARKKTLIIFSGSFFPTVRIPIFFRFHNSWYFYFFYFYFELKYYAHMIDQFLGWNIWHKNLNSSMFCFFNESLLNMGNLQLVFLFIIF